MQKLKSNLIEDYHATVKSLLHIEFGFISLHSIFIKRSPLKTTEQRRDTHIHIGI